MKKIILVLSVLMLCAAVNAQQIATLVHNDDVRIFYGASALSDAHNAAVSGDVINLSAGVFNSSLLTKNLTIRGAGWYGSERTIISGNTSLDINIPQTDSVSNVYVEGLYLENLNFSTSTAAKLRNYTFVRCRIGGFGSSDRYDIRCVGCVVNYIPTSNDAFSGSSYFLNCIIAGFNEYIFRTANNMKFVNCLLNGMTISSIANSTIQSCIIVSKAALPSTNNVVDCVATDSAVFANFGTSSNRVVSSMSLLFDSVPEMNNNDEEIADIYANTYVLTNSAKSTYVDNYGSEIGIYGGLMPFSFYPSYPRITRMHVNNQPTSDGKLNTDIEVTPAE